MWSTNCSEKEKMFPEVAANINTFFSYLDTRNAADLICVDTAFPYSDAGSWLFCGRKWIDPADPDGRDKLDLHHFNLCALFPPFAAACPRDRFIDAMPPSVEAHEGRRRRRAEQDHRGLRAGLTALLRRVNRLTNRYRRDALASATRPRKRRDEHLPSGARTAMANAAHPRQGPAACGTRRSVSAGGTIGTKHATRIGVRSATGGGECGVEWHKALAYKSASPCA